jgi:hypothetical protein
MDRSAVTALAGALATLGGAAGLLQAASDATNTMRVKLSAVFNIMPHLNAIQLT